MVNDVVYSWSAEASDITTNAEKPGAPRNLKAERSQSEGQTEIELSWQPPIVDDDGVGYGDGFGVIVKYVIEHVRRPERQLGTSGYRDAGKSLRSWRFRSRRTSSRQMDLSKAARTRIRALCPGRRCVTAWQR